MHYRVPGSTALKLGILLLPLLAAGSMAAESPHAVIPAEHDVGGPVLKPAQFQVLPTEQNGPVFANAEGKTLYTWPYAAMRNGITGDTKGKSNCTFEKRTHTAGFMSPYPPGLELPELDKRMSCAQMWPPEFAADDAKPIGNFTIITRDDGRKQWALSGAPLYTSYLDKVPGDVMGAGMSEHDGGDGPAPRRVATAPVDIPPGFAIVSTEAGRQLLTLKNASVYVSDRDGPLKSNCNDACLQTWTPVRAAELARPQGDWEIFERSKGVRQWAYRKKPLYTNILDSEARSQEGSDYPGWHNVYTQKAPPPPSEFTLQDSIAGVVLADAKGKTIYTYTCGDDSVDQLACDQVDSPQVYRFAICGGGQVERCLHDWPYVAAPASAKSPSRTWQVLDIDPKTGHLAQPGEPSLRVWAYMGKPVYTDAHDKAPGDITGNANGEFGARRNGFKAFFVRNEYSR